MGESRSSCWGGKNHHDTHLTYYWKLKCSRTGGNRQDMRPHVICPQTKKALDKSMRLVDLKSGIDPNNSPHISIGAKMSQLIKHINSNVVALYGKVYVQKQQCSCTSLQFVLFYTFLKAANKISLSSLTKKSLYFWYLHCTSLKSKILF